MIQIHSCEKKQLFKLKQREKRGRKGGSQNKLIKLKCFPTLLIAIIVRLAILLVSFLEKKKGVKNTFYIYIYKHKKPPFFFTSCTERYDEDRLGKSPTANMPKYFSVSVLLKHPFCEWIQSRCNFFDKWQLRSYWWRLLPALWSPESWLLVGPWSNNHSPTGVKSPFFSSLIRGDCDEGKFLVKIHCAKIQKTLWVRFLSSWDLLGKKLALAKTQGFLANKWLHWRDCSHCSHAN